MFYHTLVRTTYAEAVRLHPTASADLKQALKTNERVPLFIDNLAKQIGMIADKRASVGRNPPNLKHIKEIVYDMVNVMIVSLEREAAERRESDASKMLRKIENDKIKEFENASNGVMTGDFADMGIQPIEDRTIT